MITKNLDKEQIAPSSIADRDARAPETSQYGFCTSGYNEARAPQRILPHETKRNDLS
jgi:hypothetical protein